jgi:hypothetical protein
MQERYHLRFDTGLVKATQYSSVQTMIDFIQHLPEYSVALLWE